MLKFQLIGSPNIFVKPLLFNTPSGDTHIEFATVKQDPFLFFGKEFILN